MRLCLAGSLVSASGTTLEEIMDSVKKVSDIVAEIAAASNEQSAGIEQVNRAIMQMDQITQHNAALVSEAAGASRSMDQQTQRLLEDELLQGTGRGGERRGTRDAACARGRPVPSPAQAA